MQNINGSSRSPISSGSLLHNRRRSLPNIDIPANLNRRGSGSFKPSSGASTPTGEHERTTAATSSIFSIGRMISPSLRLDSPRRDVYNGLGDDSKSACKGLTTEDLKNYLDLEGAQQDKYNEHNVEDRKAFLLLTVEERNACCEWHSVDARSRYLKLSSEERGRYSVYAGELSSHAASAPAKGRVKDKLTLFLNMTKEERAELIERLEPVKNALATAKSWTGTQEELATRFCSDQSFVALLRDYLAKYGEDLEALGELRLMMLRAQLISPNEFGTKAEVEAWIRDHLPG